MLGSCSACHFPHCPHANCALSGATLVLIPGWVGLSNRLSCETGSFSHHCNPHRFLQPEDLRCLFPHTGALGCTVCLAPQLFLLVYVHMNVGPPAPPAAASPTQPASCHLAVHPCHPSCLPPPLPGLDECFFFKSLVVGLPKSSIF